MNHELKQALRPVKGRLRWNRLLRGAAAGLAAGLCGAALLQAVSFFAPVPDRGIWAAGLAAAAVLLAALGNAARPVKNTEAAETADACGLKERTITALEGTEDDPVRQLQRQDACEALRKLDVKMIRPGSVKKALFTALGCAVMLGILLMVPSPQDSEAAAQKALSRTLREGREAIAQAAEEDEAGLTDEEKSELRKITADLNRELGESRDAADALVALDKAEQRLEQFRKQTAGEAGEAMNAAAGSTGTDEARTGKNGQEGSDAAANAEAGAEGSGATAQAGDGQQGSTSAGMKASASQMQTLAALAALQNAVNPSASGMSGQAGMMGAQGQQGSQSGAGQGGQPGGKRAGNGAGEGTTNEDQSGSGQKGGGEHAPGSRSPRFKEAEYETIYDPEHIDKARQDVQTEQFRLGDEDSLQLETGPGKGSVSGDVPWSDALQEYADTEARSADRENLTVQERQWVNSYFSLLTEQK